MNLIEANNNHCFFFKLPHLKRHQLLQNMLDNVLVSDPLKKVFCQFDPASCSAAVQSFSATVWGCLPAIYHPYPQDILGSQNTANTMIKKSFSVSKISILRKFQPFSLGLFPYWTINTITHTKLIIQSDLTQANEKPFFEIYIF